MAGDRDTKQSDRFGEFLTQYDEYLDGHRSYSDLPMFKASEQRSLPRAATVVALPKSRRR